ncbi:DUF2478 domain-containing protein [Candidatus Micrarchaeota archaeon]|nr:DUF2478 domain-containing protein [Candidatus Micrarchaeota archaeon]
MPQNYFLTGMPKSGKTSVLWQLVKELRKSGLKVGGFISPDEKHHGSRTAFYVVDVETRKNAILADVNGDGPKVSKYHVNIKSFEDVAVPAMKKFKQYDVIVVDEIGRMELKSKKFAQALEEVLDSDTPIIASLSEDYVKKFEALGEVLKINNQNHESIHMRLLKETTATITKKSSKKKTVKKKAVKKKTVVSKKKAAKKKVVKKKAAPKKKRQTKKAEIKITTEKKPQAEKAVASKVKKEKRSFFGKVKSLLGI